MEPLNPGPPQVSHGFDYYVRSLTTAILALSILGALLYEVIATGKAPSLLVGWGGTIVGVYFGYHVAAGGMTAKRQVTADTGQAIAGALAGLQGPPPPPPPPAPPPPVA